MSIMGMNYPDVFFSIGFGTKRTPPFGGHVNDWCRSGGIFIGMRARFAPSPIPGIAARHSLLSPEEFPIHPPAA
ncbi:hypothetical protein J2Z17_001905 [Rhizobium halophytocola]|uniref:Uncharacterized protein n=1 Tax=Rhizobium halophytocola TaxID=735519 RepID=A0ABS4DXP9_9HYPH|nr:hypothetical protein [Rhizobium halophytocola]